MASDRSLNIVVTANLTQMKAEMAKIDAVIATTSSALKRMDSAYSGASTIAAANAATKAVMDIGGVTKLTEAEQRRLNATLTEGIAKYQALGKTAPPEMIALRDATARANTEVEKSPGLLDRMKGSSVALGAAIGTFMGNVAWSAVRKLGQEVQVFIDRGTKLAPVEQSFNRLASSIRQNAGEMLSNMKTASRGLVSEFDLMQSANKAMLLGLPVTAESMGTLTNAATTLGRAMGQTATKSVDDLITALGRSSPMILDNLGITVKVGEANEAYAKKLGKTVDALTDAEKKTAFYEAAMAKAKEMTEALGDQTETLGEIIGRVWTSFGDNVTAVVSDFNVGIGAALSNMENFGMFSKVALEQGFGAAVQFMAQMERVKGIVPELDIVQKQYVKWNQSLGENKKSLVEVATFLGVSVSSVLAYTKEITAAATGTKELNDEQKKLAAAFQKQVDILTGQALAKEVATLAREVEAAAKQGGLSAYQYDQLGDKLAKMKDEGAQLPNVLHAIWLEHELLNPSIKTTADGYAYLTKELKNLGAVQFALPPPSSLPGAGSTDFLGIGRITDQFGLAVQGLPNVPVPDFKSLGDKVLASFGRALEGLGGVIVGAIQGGGDVARAAFASIGASLGNDLGAAISKGLGGTLGKVLGGFAGPLGGLLGSALGGVVGKLFGGNDTKKGRESFARSMGFPSLAAMNAELQKMGEEGQRLFDIGVNRIGKKDAAANQAWIDSVRELFAQQNDAVSNLPPGVAGFPTRAELQQAAQDAGAAYAYMRDSGLYTADVLQQAWQQWQDALVASGDAGAIAAAKLKDELKKLSDEYDSLAQSVAQEAPEEVMGVVEAQQRAQMAALEAQKAALEAQMENSEQALGTTLDAASTAILGEGEFIRDSLDKLFKDPIMVTFDTVSIPGAWGGAQASGGDYMVTEPTFFLAGEAGPERATFTPSGKSGPGNSYAVHVHNPVVRDEHDITEVVRRVGEHLRMMGAA